MHALAEVLGICFNKNGVVLSYGCGRDFMLFLCAG